MYSWDVDCPNQINLVSHQVVMNADYLAGLLCIPIIFLLFVFLIMREYTYTGKNKKGYKETVNSFLEL